MNNVYIFTIHRSNRIEDILKIIRNWRRWSRRKIRVYWKFSEGDLYISKMRHEQIIPYDVKINGNRAINFSRPISIRWKIHFQSLKTEILKIRGRIEDGSRSTKYRVSRITLVKPSVINSNWPNGWGQLPYK